MRKAGKKGGANEELGQNILKNIFEKTGAP